MGEGRSFGSHAPVTLRFKNEILLLLIDRLVMEEKNRSRLAEAIKEVSIGKGRSNWSGEGETLSLIEAFLQPLRSELFRA
jgi:hypothetical protein